MGGSCLWGCSYRFVKSYWLDCVSFLGHASPCRWRLAVQAARCHGLVEGCVLERAVDDVAALSCEADDGCVVAFAFVAFALVVGVAFGIVERGDERGLP